MYFQAKKHFKKQQLHIYYASKHSLTKYENTCDHLKQKIVCFFDRL